jgi:hypothetical protein
MASGPQRLTCLIVNGMTVTDIVCYSHVSD